MIIWDFDLKPWVEASLRVPGEEPLAWAMDVASFPFLEEPGNEDGDHTGLWFTCLLCCGWFLGRHWKR